MEAFEAKYRKPSRLELVITLKLSTVDSRSKHAKRNIKQRLILDMLSLHRHSMLRLMMRRKLNTVEDCIEIFETK